ncbi:unnamed protein product [Adineta steineri]|uniref:Uncharacterized protein n=1 Tax=Adineta steineri TaxID=433720 RepID=A0A819P4Q4_9BILA|nr:unnamed protein product [Adineta steineri]
MNILKLDKLTDEMMNLSFKDFYNFIEIALNKELSELFQVQSIREMSSLSSVTVNQLTHILTLEITDLIDLKKSLGYMTSHGVFHLRLGHQQLLERLLSLVQAKNTSSVNNRVVSNNFIENDIYVKLTELLKHQASNLSNVHNFSILVPWIINIFQNMTTTKNRYNYDVHIQQFALLIFILGGRNCYEFLRLNLSGSLPHISSVHVIGFSSDADARYLRAMRLCSRFFATLPNFNIFKHNDSYHVKIPKQWSWFFMEEKQILSFMQDGVHIATKFRNRLLSKTAKMKIGSYSVDIQDVFDLIELESKVEHNLIKCDVDPKDRQNFTSCLRISSENVLNLLKKNEKATGTYVYLSLLRLIIIGFIERSTTIQERLLHVWTVVFTCRFWFSWIQYLELKDNRNSSATLSDLKKNTFITKPTFWCIEINAHSLLFVILLVINNKLPIDALNTFTFNSQICENTFRIARSLSGAFSSNTSFSVKSFLKRCEKISIINSIKNRGGQIGDYQFYFPQHHKNHKDTINYSIGHVNELNLTENDIEIIIKNAFEAAQKYVAMVNMTQFLEKKSIHYQIIDYTVDNNSSDEDSDEENCSDENDAFNVLNNEEQLSPNNTDDEEEGNTMATDVPDTAQKKFNGCRIYDKINPQQSKKYFRIRMGSSYKFIHKQTACWLLTTDKQRSSSDLLLCVQQ